MHGEPLDEVIYCEVMFDQGISGEIPEHRDFICRTAIPRLKKWGIPVTVLRDPSTYVDNVAHLIRRGPKRGMIRGFPLCGRCATSGDTIRTCGPGCSGSRYFRISLRKSSTAP